MAPNSRNKNRRKITENANTASTKARRWPVCLDEFEPAAKRVLDPMAYAYIAGAAGDEHTARRNGEAFASIRLKPRVLVGASCVETNLELIGEKLKFPILLAPVAYQKLAHPEGELATVRGAGTAGALLVVSTYATVLLEKVAKAASGPLWMQLYVNPDRGFTRELVARAEAAGYRGLCLTVDSPVFGTRNREDRAGFCLPQGIKAENIASLGRAGTNPHVATDGVYSPVVDAGMQWKDVDWLCSLTKLPVILKGIIAPDDASLAIEHGAAAIIVSNHGGRNLDTVPATIEALPRVAEAVQGRIPILLDGGIRRGTDVLKALALGARAVLIGRPYAYGLAVGGAEGVAGVVRILRDEFRAAMALCGTCSLEKITRAALWGE
jgi:4-hydroxymandelate oxidase